jgi:hypothetical protein
MIYVLSGVSKETRLICTYTNEMHQLDMYTHSLNRQLQAWTNNILLVYDYDVETAGSHAEYAKRPDGCQLM